MKMMLIMLFTASMAHSSQVIDIDCPDAKECFDCLVTRVAPSKVKFEFTRSAVPGRDWTPIVMVAQTSVPIAHTSRATPDLEIKYPIQLVKQNNGDWVVVCSYLENTKYGGHIGYTPMTTLTIKANEVRSCRLKNEKIVACEK